MSEGRSPRSVARAVACFRGFYRFLVIDGRLKASPAGDLRPPRAWKPLPRFLSIEDVDRLIAQPDLKTSRDNDAVQRTLERLQETARGSGNTMPAILECVRAYATVGEMCDALRDVWGEYEEVPVI